jgi:hypothetical protein
MKRIVMLSLLTSIFFTTIGYSQQDKSQRASPPAEAKQTTANGLVIAINYSQPSLKGRTLGVDVATYGKVWRTGANEATTFEISRDAKIAGQPLKAGKYSLYSIPGEDEATLIFNKAWNQWGTVYNESEDVLRVKITPDESPQFTEKMTFSIEPSGLVTFMWGNGMASFMVE